MSKLAIILGIVVLAVAFGTAPMPLTTTFENPTRNATIYPNVLIAAPLILLGVLLLLYGATAKPQETDNVR
jgi:peptidoglycan/LPS O-acetylase OafA/YrhL